MRITRGIAVAVWLALCQPANVSSGGEEMKRRVRSPDAVVIVPGIWTTWFDERPTPETVEYLKTAYNATGAPLTQVTCVRLDKDGRPMYGADGKVELTQKWVLNFHWEPAYQEAAKRNVPIIVALEPGPPVDRLVNSCKDPRAREFFSKHSRNGGVLGAETNELVIKAAIEAASQMGSVLGVGLHSQGCPNLLSTLARYPELFPRLANARITLINPAFRQDAMELVVHSPAALLPSVRNQLLSPSVRQLTAADEFSPTLYRLTARSEQFRHYLDFVAGVAPEIGRLSGEHRIQWTILPTHDRLTSVEAAKRIGQDLGARILDLKAVSLATGNTEPGNQGNFVSGNSAGSEVPTPPHSQSPHSPRDSDFNFSVLNRFMASELGLSGQKEGGVSMKMPMTQESFHKDISGELSKKAEQVRDSRPKGNATTWPGDERSRQ